MWVCACRGITDGAICSVIESGAATLEEVVLRSGAGLRCQGCRPRLEELLEQRAEPRTPVGVTPH